MFALYVEVAERCDLSKPTASAKMLAKLAASVKGLGGIDRWRQVLAKIEASTFLQGSSTSGWKVTLRWLLKSEENIAKVLDGEYDNRARPSSPRDVRF